MKKSIQKMFVPATLAVAVFSGCATPAHYIDPDGQETVVSLNAVDIQDFTMASNALVEQMLMRDAFAGAKKPRIALSLIKNDTTQNFDVSLLTDKVQQRILESGLATVSMSMSIDRKRDVVRQEMAGMGATETILPDLTLIGKIAEVQARASSTKQVSYVFSMQLADAKTGDLVWMGEKTVTKQGEKNAVGW
ncbi:MAG: hypothetical protein E7037_08630 [Verrucomicrobia bacterium]|nr:hypothetical protein [Verrucomicrobiota bacterium]